MRAKHHLLRLSSATLILGSLCLTACQDDDTDDLDPIDAPRNTWRWIDVEGMECLDGSSTGIYVNLAPEEDIRDVFIFLDSGGACFNQASCELSTTRFGEAEFEAKLRAGALDKGVFDRRNEKNPVNRMSFVVVPYCTGDNHMGSNASGRIDGYGDDLKFVGYDNLDLALRKVAATWPDAPRIVLSGEGGGGIGAYSNYPHAKELLPDVPLFLVNDSGPVFQDVFVEACLQEEIRETWNLDDGVLSDCSSCGSDTYLTALNEEVAAAIDDDASGLLITSVADSVTSSFYGFGNRSCAPVPRGNQQFLDQDAFSSALRVLRESILRPSDVGTYYIDYCPEKAAEANAPCQVHTWLSSPRFYETVIDGLTLNRAVRLTLQNEPRHVGTAGPLPPWGPEDTGFSDDDVQ